MAEALPVDINKAERLLQQLVSTARTSIKVGDTLELGNGGIDELIASYDKRKLGVGIDGFTTGWEYLDNKTCGFHGGELIMMMARAKVGKTWFCTYEAYHVWTQELVPILIITKEMGKLEIGRRSLAIDCHLPYDRFRRAALTSEEEKHWRTRAQEVKEKILSGELPEFQIHGFDLTDGGSGVASIIPLVERYLGDGGMLFVDGMYLIPDDAGESDWKGIVNVARDLKVLAQTYNIPVFATTQQSMEDKSDVPELEKAAYGKYTVQYADLILGAGRSKIDRVANRANIYILGQREGDTGNFTINMNFDPIDFSQAYDNTVEGFEFSDEDSQPISIF